MKLEKAIEICRKLKAENWEFFEFDAEFSEVTIDGHLTLEQLKAIVKVMEEKEKL